MWPEIERARDENRRELVLTGPEISKRISENDVCYEQLANLSEIKLHGNKIENIPNTIYILPSLKILDISGNQVKVLPGELADCHRLKELNLKSNPITDRRLFKLIEQCRTKQIIDYVKQHCSKTTPVQVTGANKSKKGKVKQKSESENEEDNNSSCKYCITVKPANNDFKIVIHNNVKSIREHIVCCILRNVSFSEELFKKFIQLQNKLHDSICEKRNSATIATHDFKKLGSGPLLYTSFPPRDFKIKPLNKTTEMTGAELFARLQTEANNLRKEKKRSTYSGVHKYLYLIEGKPAYPCLMNNQEEVISFPPITNSEISKIEMSTTEILIEVTSNVSQFVCKNVLSELLKDTAVLFDKNLEVCQVRILDQDGKLKVVFPSKVDLNFGKDSNVKCQFENVG
ncbi:leucine-rich repeat-containing protein 47-like isoform X2 [Cylas formicarius]|uniref:leucine-rich repeat-containing protein 47-like isoform X2 n=1 Tax=Cylas formicarius TaxID=197179 RepID=UPI0029584EE4|nr:leucine-rich repeat-containing protein 47-like isoform X2 [Cylas formicarius]